MPALTHVDCSNALAAAETRDNIVKAESDEQEHRESVHSMLVLMLLKSHSTA